MNAYWVANWQIWVSAFCVLAIYSYLVKDNVLYRTMMQVFIGANLGYQAIVQWKDVLYPQWWLPMTDGFGALFGRGGNPWGALWAIVGVLGLLFYFQLSRKYFWLSRIVIGITIGIGAGLTFKSQLGQNMPQITDSFKQLGPAMAQPAPKVLLHLPGADYEPAVDGSLVFFQKGRTTTAVEPLGGVVVWQTAVAFDPTGPARLDGDSIRLEKLDSGTGLFQTIRKADGRLEPIGLADSTSLHGRGSRASEPFKPYLLADRAITVLDPDDHSVVAVLPVPSRATSDPCVVSFREPQYANGVLLAPIGTEILALAVRAGVAENVKEGDVLWRADIGEPIRSVQSFDGVILVQGQDHSVLWLPPNPAPRLTAGDYFDNWVFVATVICVMTYFFFIFPHPGPVMAGASKAGRWLLMIGFGAFFGNTVMTRMSFLLDRLMFLIDDWLRPFCHQLFH